MSEKAEASPRKRLEYGAVPLQPWTAPHPDMEGVTYTQASIGHILERLDTNIHLLVENEWATTPEELIQIHELCKVSLMDTQMRRIVYHGENTAVQHDEKGALVHVNADINGKSDIIQAAKDGTATPAEMLAILRDNPSLGGIELAKLSHPFDSSATIAMYADISQTLKNLGVLDVVTRQRRYKVKRADPVLQMAVVLEKEPIGYIESVEGDPIEIVIRRSFLVRTGHSRLKQLSVDEERDVFMGNYESFADVTRELRDGQTEVVQSSSLNILTTSVYARAN